VALVARLKSGFKMMNRCIQVIALLLIAGCATKIEHLQEVVANIDRAASAINCSSPEYAKSNIKAIAELRSQIRHLDRYVATNPLDFARLAAMEIAVKEHAKLVIQPNEWTELFALFRSAKIDALDRNSVYSYMRKSSTLQCFE